jgi:putative transcriptional regulator
MHATSLWQGGAVGGWARGRAHPGRVAAVCAGILWAIAGTPTAASPPQAAAAPRPARGKLLVASPRLEDPNFSRSVVVLLEHGPAGAVGVVVNRRTEVPLATAMRDVPELAGRADRLHLGGPVDPSRVLLLVRTREKPEDSLRILDEVWVTGSIDALKHLIHERKGKAEFRVFAGYAGWGAGQLEAEVRRGDWLVADGDPTAIFGDAASMWQRLVDRLSGQWVRALRPATERRAAAIERQAAVVARPARS